MIQLLTCSHPLGWGIIQMDWSASTCQNRKATSVDLPKLLNNVCAVALHNENRILSVWPCTVKLVEGVVNMVLSVCLAPASRVLIMLAWALVSLAVFLCPLLIHDFSPCVLEELPPKPALVGHRGAPMVSTYIQ